MLCRMAEVAPPKVFHSLCKTLLFLQQFSADSQFDMTSQYWSSNGSQYGCVKIVILLVTSRFDIQIR